MPPRNKQERINFVKGRNFKDDAASYFNGTKRAFGTDLPAGHFTGKPWREWGRGWCPKLQGIADNSDLELQVLYRFTKEGIRIFEEWIDQATGEVVHRSPEEWVMGNAQNGNDLEKAGQGHLVGRIQMVHENLRKE